MAPQGRTAGAPAAVPVTGTPGVQARRWGALARQWWLQRGSPATAAVRSATVAHCSISSTPVPDFGDHGDHRDQTADHDQAQAQGQLVEEQVARPRDQRLGQHAHLLLAAGQRPGLRGRPLSALFGGRRSAGMMAQVPIRISAAPKQCGYKQG
jgi:hypothetical protein